MCFLWGTVIGQCYVWGDRCSCELYGETAVMLYIEYTVEVCVVFGRRFCDVLCMGETVVVLCCCVFRRPFGVVCCIRGRSL